MAVIQFDGGIGATPTIGSASVGTPVHRPVEVDLCFTLDWIL